MGKDISKVTHIFQFCDGGSCRKAGSELAIREARAYLKNEGWWNEAHTIKTRCNGRCEDAPTWIAHPGNYWYKNLTPEKGLEILQSHLEQHKPIEEYLLYQPAWKAVKSEKEREKEPISFKEVTDSVLGEVLIARMPSSEQDLYPLFKYVFERYNQIVILEPGQQAVELSIPPVVNYTDEFDITIHNSEINLTFAIAPIPQHIAGDIAMRKIGVTELIRTKGVLNSVKEGLRFKDRKGKELLTIWFKDVEGEIWRHLLRNFLQLPVEELEIKVNENK